MSAKLITVFGATGQQGNNVAKALLSRGYKVKAVTRNPDNEKAKELQGLGAEIVQVKNMDDNSQLEVAIQGSYGVFAVTNFWGLFAENQATAFDRELAQGKAIGDACKKYGIKHLVFSGLEYVKDIIGKDCPHFDGKGLTEKYLDEIQVPNTSTRYAFYFDNFTGMLSPQKQEDGSFVVALPGNKPFDGVATADCGPAVATIFDNPDQYIGKKIGFSGDKLHGSDYASIMSKVLGKTIVFNFVPPAVYATLFPGADDMAVMFEFYDHGDGPDRSIELTKKLNPDTLGFEAWVEKNKDKFNL